MFLLYARLDFCPFSPSLRVFWRWRARGGDGASNTRGVCEIDYTTAAASGEKKARDQGRKHNTGLPPRLQRQDIHFPI